jgi:hypothetical protein
LTVKLPFSQYRCVVKAFSRFSCRLLEIA